MTDFERFTRDVERHELTILRDDRLYRHLRFRRPETYCYGFDIVTWPGYLAYTGDMGCFVFSRLPDMLEFFRGRNDGWIDFRYWAEKCVSRDRDGVLEFSEDLFRAAVEEDILQFVDTRDGDECDIDELREAVRDEVLCSDALEDDGIELAHRFRFHGKAVFQDFWEHRLEDYTGRFTWCCYALRWAIAKYDVAKAVDTEQGEPATR